MEKLLPFSEFNCFSVKNTTTAIWWPFLEPKKLAAIKVRSDVVVWFHSFFTCPVCVQRLLHRALCIYFGAHLIIRSIILVWFIVRLTSWHASFVPLLLDTFIAFILVPTRRHQQCGMWFRFLLEYHWRTSASAGLILVHIAYYLSLLVILLCCI